MSGQPFYIDLSLSTLSSDKSQQKWKDILSPEALRKLAGVADESGFDTVSALRFGPSGAFDGGAIGPEGGVAAAYLAPLTKSVSLVVAVDPDIEQPYNAARCIASLDHISGGRAAWAIQFRGENTERIAEFVAVARDLWDTWLDDAVRFDKATGVRIAPGSVRYANHVGRHYRVRGPLNVSRPPQGHIPLVGAVSSLAGASLAGAIADVIIVASGSAEETKAIRTHFRQSAVAAGRDADSVAVLATVAPIFDETANAPADRRAIVVSGSAQRVSQSLLALIDGEAADGFSILSGGSLSGIQRFVDDVLPRLPGRQAPPAAGATLRQRYGLPRPADRRQTAATEVEIFEEL